MGDDNKMGSLFFNLIILMPKNDYVKLVIDVQTYNTLTPWRTLQFNPAP